MKRFGLIHELDFGFFPNYAIVEVLAVDIDAAAYIFGLMVEELQLFGIVEIDQPIEFETLKNEN